MHGGKIGQLNGNRVRSLVLAVLLTFTPLTVTSAQEEEASEIEEMVVTAQKREQSLMDVPMAVSTLSSADVESMGAVNLEEIQFKIPSLFVSSLGGDVQNIRMRGISPPGTLLPTVGRLIDEMSVNIEMSGYGIDFPLVDIERVEVLKGPQGTLYGEGSISGTVKYATRNPSSGKVDGIVEVSGRTVDDGSEGYRMHIAGNLPTGSETFGIRLSAYQEQAPGWVDNHFGGKDANELERWFFRTKAVFKPSDRLTARLLWQHQENKLPYLHYSHVDFTSSYFNPYPNEVSFDIANLVLEWDLDQWAITSTTGYQDRDIVTSVDVSGYKAFVEVFFPGFTDWAPRFGGQIAVPNYITNIGYSLDRSMSTFTQEVRVNAQVTERVLAIGGVLYKDSEFISPLFTEYYPDPDVLDLDALTGELLIKTEALAWFAEATVSVTDRLESIFGLRYYADDRESSNILYFFGDSISVVDALENDSTVVRAVLKYEVNEDVMVYATYSEGFRSGGVQLVDTASTLGLPNIFDPEELSTVEAGVKGVFGDGAFSYEAAAFFTTYQNIQVYVANPLGLQAFSNGGEAEVTGLEIQGKMRLTEEFFIEGSYGLNDGEYTEPGGTHEKGEPMDSVPRHTFSISADLSFGLPGGFVGHARADYLVSDDTFINARGFGYVDESLVNEGLETLNFRVGGMKYDWSVYMFVENLTGSDKEIARPYATRIEYVIQQPRTVGVTIRGKFKGL